MLCGPDGKSVVKMSWVQFQEWQRWDEFSERSDDPPMTVDFMFWYKGKKYYCTGEHFGNVIVDANWHRLAYNKNFLLLLETPVFDGKTFHECLDDILIAE